MIGQSIAHYKITAKLGEGGMGEVYRATDLKLNREVALKVLPESFAQDPDRMARFQREAHVLASLNHPNIAAIYGLEESESAHTSSASATAIVMELVDGETLADRLRRGPLALDESLRVAGQIADALDAAHHKGIVHRDLKPANVKITPAGT
ncbi:MAG: serine/threonine protein kinase, partial [Acidobacteriia bacterium]|nr:serine/threonine protein kinase [Terriglobia bacterium]